MRLVTALNKTDKILCTDRAYVEGMKAGRDTDINNKHNTGKLHMP